MSDSQGTDDPRTKPDWRGWPGYLGRAIGRFTESEGGDSPETQDARRGLFAVYDEWVSAGRPDFDPEPIAELTDDQRARFEAAAERGLEARRHQLDEWLICGVPDGGPTYYPRPGMPGWPHDPYVAAVFTRDAALLQVRAPGQLQGLTIRRRSEAVDEWDAMLARLADSNEAMEFTGGRRYVLELAGGGEIGGPVTEVLIAGQRWFRVSGATANTSPPWLVNPANVVAIHPAR